MKSLSLIKILIFLLYNFNLYILCYSMALSQNRQNLYGNFNKQPLQFEYKAKSNDIRYKRSPNHFSLNDVQSKISNEDDNNINNVNDNENDIYEILYKLLHEYDEYSNIYLQHILNTIVSDSSNEELTNQSILLYLTLIEQLKQKMPRSLNDEQSTTRRTPRLGRSINYHLYNDNGAGEIPADLAQYFYNITNKKNSSNYNKNNDNFDYNLDHFEWPRIIKKSMPFKPRLGKRAQIYV